jgi:hypothetical protein
MRSLFAFLVAALLGIVLAPRAAWAAPSVKAEKTTLTEADGRWRLKLSIDYGSVPDIAFVPMIFDFEPVTYYERALTDESPEKPVLNKKPLQNMKHINESMEVGFSDGTGKAFKVTKFDFAIRRDRGFEAGEYKLIVKMSDSGKQIGQPIRLVLEGDNPVVDRRAISFVGEKADGDKKGKPKSKHADSDVAKSDAGSSDPAPASDGEPAPADGAEAPPPVEPKQGGCGCEVPGRTTGPANGALGLLAAVAGLAFIGGRARARSAARAAARR